MDILLDTQQKACAKRAIATIESFWRSKGKKVSVWYVKKPVFSVDGKLIHYDYEIKSNIKVTWKEQTPQSQK